MKNNKNTNLEKWSNKAENAHLDNFDCLIFYKKAHISCVKSCLPSMITKLYKVNMIVDIKHYLDLLKGIRWYVK